MAHLPSDAAIFSPSVARLAASTAKDWSHVDNWLASKYKGRTPPPFERNPDTLKALLALANLNEASDENRDLLARVSSSALRDVRAAEEERRRRRRRSHDDHEGGDDDDGENRDDVVVTTTTRPLLLPSFKDDFFAALEDDLTRDGAASLDVMAAAAVRLGVARPEPAQLGQAMLALQARHSDLAQAAARVDVLRRHVDAESARVGALHREVAGGDEYRPPADLARQNLDTQRKVKAVAKKLPEMRDRVSSLARAVGVPDPTIEQVRLEEEKYLRLLDTKKKLDQQLREFEGLPPDTTMARQQLEDLRRELRNITDRRDAVFEGLVERETPRKGR